MATNAVKLFPRGYSGGQSRFVAHSTTRGGDAEVSELWAKYTSPNNQSTSWSFRRKVISAAKRLLTANTNWFLQQEKNPNIVEYNYQFVVDTLRFIGTGYRRINVYAWSDLVSHAPADGLDGVGERDDIAKAFHDLKLDVSIDALLQLWCSRPGGFDDMINSINILFGDIPIATNRGRNALANSWSERV